MTHRHLQRGCSESRGRPENIHTGLFFFPTNIAGGFGLTDPCPTRGSSKQEWGCGWGAVPGKPTSTHCSWGRAPSGVQQSARLATTQQGMLVRATCREPEDPNRWSFREAGLGKARSKCLFPKSHGTSWSSHGRCLPSRDLSCMKEEFHFPGLGGWVWNPRRSFDRDVGQSCEFRTGAFLMPECDLCWVKSLGGMASGLAEIT